MLAHILLAAALLAPVERQVSEPLIVRVPRLISYATPTINEHGWVEAVEQPLMKARDWFVDFPPTVGVAGQTIIITALPQVLFRVENLFANDTAPIPGTGTRVGACYVGNHLQRPALTSTLTLFTGISTKGPPKQRGKGPSASDIHDEMLLGYRGLDWDTCQPAIAISIEVIFSQSCQFDCVLYGKAVVPRAADDIEMDDEVIDAEEEA